MSDAERVRQKISFEQWIEDIDNRIGKLPGDNSIVSYAVNLRVRLRDEIQNIDKELGIDETSHS